MSASAARPGADAPTRLRLVSPPVVALGRALLADLGSLTDRLVEAILHEDPSYSGPGRVRTEDLRASCHSNLHSVLATLVGDADPASPETLAPPRTTGSRRAEQGLPMESVLHAYRLGFRTIWEAMVAQARGTGDVEALVEAATEVWEIVDLFSSSVADSYRTTGQAMSRRDDRWREALLDALLDGRGREWVLLDDAAAGLELPGHGRFVVVVVDGTEHGLAVRAALVQADLRSVWRTRAADEVGLVLLGGVGSRGHRPADVVAALQPVPGLRAGVSPEVDGLAAVDTGHRAASTAVRALPVGQQRVAELDARLPAALLVTAPDLARRLVARALGGVLELASEERDLLLDTLRSWLATNGSAGQTATRLYCHRNTVLNRLHRVEALTGRSAERVDDLVEWSLALLALDVLPVGGTSELARPLT